MRQHGRLGGLRRFAKDRGGVSGITFALVLTLVLAMSGIAIDYVQAFLVKSRLQHALDASVLAAATRTGISDADRITHARQVFSANFPAAELGTPATPNITISADGKVTGTVTAVVDTTLSKVIGFDNLNVGALSEVQSASAQGEVVLVLDYSGSMNSNGKYEAMRDAATGLINMLSNNGTNTSVKFGLVPFSAHVYGTLESDYIVNETPGGMWTNCTQDRRHDHNIQDTTPITSNDATKWGMTCTASGGGEEDEEDEEGGGGACNAYSICSNYSSRNLIIQPLSSNHATTISNLNSMSPYANTHISLGLSFGWHLISPNAPWEEGVAYNSPGHLKAIVLLTDGMQTSDGWGPGDTHSVGNAETNLEDMCTAIKDKGVILLTVAFDLNDNSTENRLRDCASSEDHFFFDVDTGAELLAAFKSIGTQLSGLMRISK